MAGLKIRKGDQVVILSGKDKGKEGVVHEALPAEGKVIVEGVDTAKRHRAARSATDTGGIIHIDKPIPVSNVAVVSPSDGKPTRVGYKVEAGKKVRVCKRTGVELPMTETIEIPRLKTRYDSEIRDQLKESLGLGNIMEVPRLEKIVVNMGVGEAVGQGSLLEHAVTDLTLITGQKPLITRAKKSIASFKLREGNAIGAKVTLRGDRMWEFLDRLIALAIPRIRDFRGLPAHSFDGRGNYTFGVTEQLIFPEIDYDKIDQTRGMDITIVTTARTNAEGKALLDAFGFPFKREGQAN